MSIRKKILQVIEQNYNALKGKFISYISLMIVSCVTK
jgi:hypothetical protein